MLKNFLIICVCVCCVIAIFALPHRWNYEGVQEAISFISDETDMVQDDFSLISLISYYMSDRLSVDYSAGENIFFRRHVAIDPDDPDNTDKWRYFIDYTYQISYHTPEGEFIDFKNYRDERFFFSSQESRDRAWNVLNMIVVPDTDFGSLEDIPVISTVLDGVVILVEMWSFIIGIICTFVYFFFDIFGVTFSVMRAGLWLLGFI